MSKHKVSRGNTSDLIGLWNNRANTETSAEKSEKIGSTIKPGNLLSVKHQRKTSAYVPKIVEEKIENNPKFRKTSAMVLLPTRPKSPVGQPKSLNVDSSIFSPMKKSSNVSGLENQTDLPKLRSALKLSTVLTPPEIKTENFSESRRGSVGLGRSKSVCHKVKFVPQIVKTEHETGKPEFQVIIVLLPFDTQVDIEDRQSSFMDWQSNCLVVKNVSSKNDLFGFK